MCLIELGSLIDADWKYLQIKMNWMVQKWKLCTVNASTAYRRLILRLIFLIPINDYFLFKAQNYFILFICLIEFG
jgi:hypothetical protein